jgi:hypothetical protein
VTGPPRRVRVTSPRTAGTRARPRAVTSEIDARTRLGQMYVSSLLRTQLRLGLTVLVLGAGPVAALPVVFRLFPEISMTEVLGMPLHWVLLAFAVYPMFFVAGLVYVARAERNEQAFAAMVRDADDRAPQDSGQPR